MQDYYVAAAWLGGPGSWRSISSRSNRAKESRACRPS